MHYKNGREAKNGDLVGLVGAYGKPAVGMLYDAVPGNDTCNARLAMLTPNDLYPNLAECLHADDAVAILRGAVPDTSKASPAATGAAKVLLALMFAAVAAVLFAPAVALAQDVAPAVPTVWAMLLSYLLSPGGVIIALGAIGTAIGFIGNGLVWKRRLALLVHNGFNVVEDLDAELGDTKLDKTAAFLKAMDDYCKANGWRSLKPGEVEVAKLQAQAMNGAAEAEEAIRTKALIAAAPVTARATAELIAGLK